MTKIGFLRYYTVIAGSIIGSLMILSGGATAGFLSITGVAMVVASLGIEGSFIKALKAIT